MSQKTPSADSVPWLYHLEKPLKSIDKHKDFTLWLTTEAHSNFEAMLLQSSLKLTFESPPGIKQNLLRTYSAWEPSLLTLSGARGFERKCCLCWRGSQPSSRSEGRTSRKAGQRFRSFRSRICDPQLPS